MNNKALKLGRWSHITFYFLFLTSYFLLLTSCGYQLIGSKSMPFNSATIKPVKNKTYEPHLEEKLHNAISTEFVVQGINVMTSGGDIELEATVTTFELSTIASIEEKVQEQAVTMRVDIRITDKGKITEFTSIESPIRITFQSTGSVIDAVVQKEKAINKACTEIAREIISKIIIMYAKGHEI